MLQPAVEGSGTHSRQLFGRPAVCPGLLGLEPHLQKCTPGTKGPFWLLPDLKKIPAFKDGVEIMRCQLPILTIFLILFFQTEPEWHVVETNRHL